MKHRRNTNADRMDLRINPVNLHILKVEEEGYQCLLVEYVVVQEGGFAVRVAKVKGRIIFNNNRILKKCVKRLLK